MRLSLVRASKFYNSFPRHCVAALTVFTEGEHDDDPPVERQVLVTQLTTAREVVRVMLAEVRSTDSLGSNNLTPVHADGPHQGERE